MTIIDITKAQHNLAALIEAATQGNEVIITRPDGIAMQLVPVVTETPKLPAAVRERIEQPTPALGQFGQYLGNSDQDVVGQAQSRHVTA